MADQKKPDLKVVEATAVAVAPSKGTSPVTAKQIEAAISAAIAQAYREGVRDPAKIKERMQAAREKALRQAG